MLPLMLTNDTDPARPADDRFGRRVVQWAGVISIVGGLALLLAWLLRAETLAGIMPGWPTTKANTALCFILLGIALPLRQPARRPIACPLCLLIAMLTLAQYTFGVDLGIDELLVRDRLTPAEAFPGRMSPATASCLALLAIGCGVRAGTGRIPVQFGSAGIVLFISLLVLFVYAYQAEALGEVGLLATMSLPTALLLAIQSAAICATTRGARALRMLPGTSTGGTALRRMLPGVLIGPLLLGGLVTVAGPMGILQASFATAAFAAAMTVAGLAILLWNAQLVSVFERRRAETEQNMQRAFTSSLVPTLLVDQTGCVQTSNRVAQDLFGYSAEEFEGLSVEELVPPGRRAGHARLRAGFFACPAARPMGQGIDLYGCRRDGTEFPVEIGLNPIPSRSGDLVVVTILDLTARRSAEQAIRENEHRLSLVYEATNEAIWEYNVNDGRVWWNPAADRLLGARAEQGSGLLNWWRQRIHPDDRERVWSSLQHAIQAGDSTWTAAYRFERLDGRVLHLLDRARIDRRNDGRAVQVVGARLDRTEAHRHEERLRTSETRARAMVDQAPMLMWISDERGQVIYLNRAWRKFTGRPLDAARGDGWLGSVHPEERVEVEAELGEAMARRAALVRQCRVRDAEGQYRWVLWHALPWRSDDFGGYIGCGIDIDVMKHSLEELTRSNAELENFAYVASHDLQEPLRMVSSFCQLLDRRYADQLDETGHEFIDFAVDGAQRMQQLIDDLLAYSRVGRTDTAFEPVSIATSCDRALQYLSATIADSGATVRCGDLPIVRGNDGQLTMVFQNLIANAIKFRSEAAPEVDISAAPEHGGWRFLVRDNGIGIQPQHADRIFRIFQRLHGREAYPGSGIGLAICKKIIETHGGWIRVEPQSGPGCTFAFWLPRADQPGDARLPDQPDDAGRPDQPAALPGSA